MACTHVSHFEHDVRSVAVAPDGQLLAVGSWGDGLQLLDAHFAVRHPMLDGASYHFIVGSVAFSPTIRSSQPQLLAVGFFGGTVRVWDCSSSSCVAELQSHSESVCCVAFSPDGRLLASASLDNTVRLWRTDDWHAPPAVVRGHGYHVAGVAFSCDSRLLASCSYDRTVRLWRILDRDAAVAPAPSSAPAAGPALNVGRSVLCVAFSAVDSRLLACGGDEGFLALVRVGACDGDGDGAIAVERELQGHTLKVFNVAFSPCGRTLASGSQDHTVRLWSVASGACLRVLRGHTDEVNTVAFFPNCKQLASGSDDHTVRIWTACAWSDTTHRLFGAPLKAAVFSLMSVRARLEQEGQGLGDQHALQLPRLPMEVWLLVFGQLQLALGEADGVSETRVMGD